MTKVKLVLLGMLAVYAVSLAASATASAAVGYWDCQNRGSGGHWKDAHCTEKQEGGAWDTKGLTGTETKGIEGTSGVSTLESKVGGNEIKIRCLKDRIPRSPFTFVGANGVSEGEVEFRECTFFVNGVLTENCIVHEPIVFRFRDQLVVNSKQEIEDEFKGVLAEEVFVEIKVEGALCSLKNTYKPKGSQLGALPNGQQPLVTHQIVFTPGSKLFLGSEPAKFTSEEHINVFGGPQWGSS